MLIAEKPRGSNPRIWGLLTLMVTFVGLFVAMAGKILDMRWLSFTGLFIMICAMFGVAAYALVRETRPRKRGTRQPMKPQAIEQANTTNRLLPIGDNDFIPSVTDRTTDLLETPAKKRSRG